MSKETAKKATPMTINSASVDDGVVGSDTEGEGVRGRESLRLFNSVYVEVVVTLENTVSVGIVVRI